MRPDVTLISPYPAPGEVHAGFSGVASYTANLATALAAEGASVHVIAELPDGTDRSYPTHEEHCTGTGEPIRVTRAFTRGPRALIDAARAAREIRAAVTHLQFEMFLYGGPPALAALPAALAILRASGQGPVVTMHQVLDPASIDRDTVAMHRVTLPPLAARIGIGALQQLIGRLATTTIVHEAPFARLVPSSVVVPHGLERLNVPPRDDARRHLGLDDDRLTVLAFGFIAPYKGLELILQAGEMAGHEVEVVVAGGEHPRLAGRDPYANALRARHGHHARFTGWVPEADVGRWFSAADVAVYPYPRPFSASGSLALALAHRTPVLLSPTLARFAGAPSDLVMPTTPRELSEQLTDAVNHPERLKRLAAWAETLAAGRWWDDVARHHLEIYQELPDAGHLARRRLRAGQPG